MKSTATAAKATVSAVSINRLVFDEAATSLFGASLASAAGSSIDIVMLPPRIGTATRRGEARRTDNAQPKIGSPRLEVSSCGMKE